MLGRKSAHIVVQVFKNASKFIGFRALKGTFCQKILNYEFQVRGRATENALDIEIMFTIYKNGGK